MIDVKAYASSASRILFTTLLGKILGFLKIVLLIRLYGVGPFSDSIIVVISIYWFWSSVLVYSLFSISLISKLGKARSQQRQLAVTLKTLHAVNVLACIFIAIVGANTEGVLSLFSPVPDPIFIHYSKLLLTSLLPLLFLMPLTEIFTILNQYNDRMVTASSNLSVWNFLQIAALFFGAYSMMEVSTFLMLFALLTVVGYVITGYVQTFRSGFFQLYPIWALFGASFGKARLLFRKNTFFFASALLMNLNAYIDNYFLAALGSGAISIYNIIIRVPDVMQSLLVSAFGVVFFNIVVQNKGRAREIFSKFLFIFAMMFLPCLFLAKSFGVEFLGLIYGQNAIGVVSSDTIRFVLVTVLANIFFLVSSALLFKIFIVEERSKFVVIISSVTVALNYGGNYLLMPLYGVSGVALATLCSGSFFFVALFIATYKPVLRKVLIW